MNKISSDNDFQISVCSLVFFGWGSIVHFVSILWFSQLVENLLNRFDYFWRMFQQPNTTHTKQAGELQLEEKRKIQIEDLCPGFVSQLVYHLGTVPVNTGLG